MLEKGFGPLDVAKRARQDFAVTVGDDAAGRRRGWAVAQFLTAHAATLKVTEVAFDGKRWRVGKDVRARLDERQGRVGPGQRVTGLRSGRGGRLVGRGSRRFTTVCRDDHGKSDSPSCFP